MDNAGRGVRRERANLSPCSPAAFLRRIFCLVRRHANRLIDTNSMIFINFNVRNSQAGPKEIKSTAEAQRTPRKTN